MVIGEVQAGSESTGEGRGAAWSRGSMSGDRMNIELGRILNLSLETGWKSLTTFQRFLHSPASHIHEWYPRSSQPLMQTPQVSPTIVDYSISSVVSLGEKSQLTSFLTFHHLKASRRMVSLLFHLSTKKKKILMYSVMCSVDSSYFQIHLTQAPVSQQSSLYVSF